MNKQELYELWERQKSQIEMGRDLPERVMNRIYRYQDERKPFFNVNLVLERIFAHPLAKVAALAGGAVIGLTRLFFVLCVVLR